MSESPVHAVDIEAFELQNHLDPHHRASNLSDIILGGQDGLVNVPGVILGVAAIVGSLIPIAPFFVLPLISTLMLGNILRTSLVTDRLSSLRKTNWSTS